MSSISSGIGQTPLVSSVAGLASSGKDATSVKAANADGGASKVAEKAHAEANGLRETESSPDRDADGRQLYHAGEESASSQSGEAEEFVGPGLARSQDPHKTRGNRLDLDA